MRLRKLLAMLLTLSMLISMVPSAAFAAETGSEPSGEAEVPTVVNPDNLFLDKTATLTDNGTYTIDLEAYATGSPITKTVELGVPLDVVLVVDQSGSLQYVTQEDGTKQFNGAPLAALKASVSSFVHELQANADANGLDHRVSICGFGSDEYIGWSGVPEYDKADNYTYAGELKDIYFTNTGLFVNGEFKKYGASTYEPFIVEKVEDVVDNKIYVAREKGTQRYLPVYYYPGHSAWRLWVSGGWWTFFNKDLTDEEKAAIKEAYGSDKAGANAAIGEAEKELNVLEFLEKYDLYYLNREVTVQLTDEDYQNSWENVSVNGSVNPDIAKTIDSLAGNGATFSSYGMRMARKMLENAPATADGVERKKVVIVFTDGVPGGTGVKNEGEADSTLAEAQKIKDGLFDKNGNAINAEIYTVGIYEGNTGEDAYEFMNQLSSNCASHKFADEPVSAVLDTSQEKYLAINLYLTLTPYFYKLEKENGDVEYCPIKVFRSSTSYDWRYVSDEGLLTIPAGMVSSDDPKTITGVYTLESGEYNPDLGYYSNSDNFSDLPGLFREILKEVSTYSSEVQLDAKAILKDVLADGFKLTGNTTVTVSLVPGSVSEENKDLTEKQLTSDKITWGEAQQILTFAYPDATTGNGAVTVGEETIMTLTAQASEDGVVTVSGFAYADQFICYGHDGYKLVVSITGVEADADIATGTVLETNHGTSGIYEGAESDADEDGEKGEIQAVFPIPTTYLTSKTYYLDYTGSITIDPEGFLMTVKGVNADIDGYNFFDPATPGTKIETEYGEVTVNEDGSITYTLTKNNWENPDIFYLFGTTNDPTVTGATANENGNMWSKITIIPPEDIRGNMYVDKKATLTDNGTYTIDLEAYATGTPAITSIIDGIPLDVVLVLDQSGSLVTGDGGGSLETLKSSVTSFIEALKTNGEAFGVNHRVAVCGFASGAKQGASGVKYYGLSYANNIQDNAWINTGLFVNGQFKDYGTLEYIPVESVDDIVSSRYYAVEHDFDEDGIMEISRAYVKNGAWVVSSGTPSGTQYITLAGVTKDADGNVTATANENLFNNYKVYTVGDSSNLLTDADYAASWENIADGLNGQGNINPDITKTIDSLAASGATATFYGLKMAARMLANVPDDGIERKRVVIVFTDGVPGYTGYTQGDGDAALSEVMKIKETDAEVYAVGIYKASSAASVETFMNQLSSNYVSHSFTTEPIQMDMAKAGTGSTFLKYTRNIDGSYYGISPYFRKVVNDDGTEDFWPISISYDPNDTSVYYASYITDDAEILIGYGAKDAIPGIVGDVYMLAEPVVNDHPDADYYKYSTTIDDLSAIFQAITTDATTFASEVALGVDAILKDVMASNFVLTDNTSVTVSVVPGSISKENEDLTADQMTSDKITWGEAQLVLTFNYPEVKEGTGTVVVNGAADQTEMTITAKVDENGVITVTGFNYANPLDDDKINAQFIGVDHPGSKLLVTITGVEATSDVVTDGVTATNQGTSGIYEPEDSDADEDGEKGEIQASFPIPTTYLTSKVYVVDYAKPMTIDPADFKMTIGAVSLDNKGGYFFFDPAVIGITKDYGKVAVESGKLIYTPTNTNWDGYDTFYVFGTTGDTTITSATANENGNMWAKVSVIPANNVYYEDTFVTDEGTGTAGIVYSGSWTEVDEDGNEIGDSNGQGENAEENESTEGDNQGSVHGWEDTLSNDTGYSDGSAHKVSYDPESSATATFTFTGTGVDIYSRTNPTTGIVIAMLYKGTSTTDADGKNLVAEKALMVDNLAASGDYYQIPTLSLNGLEHGTYTVRIIVSKASDSQTGAERFIYYLDGIRVYNPIQNLEGNETVSGAYGEEELNANFVEIRDKLLDANSFSAEDDGLSAGPVFIDRITSEEGDHTDNTEAFEIGTYKVFGPENEVYLSAGQMIAFAVEYREGAHYYIGMKSLTGSPAGVSFDGADGVMETISIGHTTDLYYEVAPAWTEDENGNRIGIIMILADSTNGGYAIDENGDYIADENGDLTYEGSILALTKLKVTGPAAQTFKFAMVRNSVLLSYAADVTSSNESDAEDPSEGGENTDPTEPGTPDIENPEPEAPADDWDDMARKLLEALLKKIFDDLRRWFMP